jgi:hypothetical protein
MLPSNLGDDIAWNDLHTHCFCSDESKFEIQYWALSISGLRRGVLISFETKMQLLHLGDGVLGQVTR